MAAALGNWTKQNQLSTVVKGGDSTNADLAHLLRPMLEYNQVTLPCFVFFRILMTIFNNLSTIGVKSANASFIESICVIYAVISKLYEGRWLRYVRIALCHRFTYQTNADVRVINQGFSAANIPFQNKYTSWKTHRMHLHAKSFTQINQLR